ncbi:MAG: 30S ribosomal protein S20 [Vicinamibacterales bacterium]
MASKSALKAHRQSVKRREHNRQLRSKLRTAIKKIRGAVAAKDAKAAGELLVPTISLIDKMVTKRIIHDNTAGRYKSRLQKQVSALS